MYLYVYVCREKKRDDKQRARVKVTIIQMESEAQRKQTRDKRRHWRQCVWFKKKSLQAHLLDRLPIPHLRPHLMEIDYSSMLSHVRRKRFWSITLPAVENKRSWVAEVAGIESTRLTNTPNQGKRCTASQRHSSRGFLTLGKGTVQVFLIFF